MRRRRRWWRRTPRAAAYETSWAPQFEPDAVKTPVAPRLRVPITHARAESHDLRHVKQRDHTALFQQLLLRPEARFRSGHGHHFERRGHPENGGVSRQRLLRIERP